MSLRLVILVLVGAAIGTVLVVQQQMNAIKPKGLEGPVTSATPPASAQYLPEDYMHPHMVIGACQGRGGEGNDDVIAQFVGLWTKSNQWEGEVLKVEVSETKTLVTMKIESSTPSLTALRVVAEIPGENYTVEAGGLMKFSGRIARIDIQANPQLSDAIYLDGVTVRSFQKRRN